MVEVEALAVLAIPLSFLFEIYNFIIFVFILADICNAIGRSRFLS